MPVVGRIQCGELVCGSFYMRQFPARHSLPLGFDQSNQLQYVGRRDGIRMLALAASSARRRRLSVSSAALRGSHAAALVSICILLAPTKDCGNYYSTLGAHAFNGTAGWHSYIPPTTGSTNTSSQTYLNGLVTGTGQLTFSLAAGSALERTDGVAPTTSEPWRNPTNDYGYFLTTNGSGVSQGSPCARERPRAAVLGEKRRLAYRR